MNGKSFIETHEWSLYKKKKKKLYDTIKGYTIPYFLFYLNAIPYLWVRKMNFKKIQQVENEVLKLWFYYF